MKAFPFLLAVSNLVLSATAQAANGVDFIPGPSPDFGNAYFNSEHLNSMPERGTVYFPATIVPGARGTIEFWGRLFDFPDNVQFNNAQFFSHGLSPLPSAGFRLGFGSNNGCGGGGLWANIGVAVDNFCTANPSIATTNFFTPNSYADILGDKSAWHHYALVWNQDAPRGRRLAIFVDGALTTSNYSDDRAPTELGDPANFPNEYFNLILNYQGQGSMAMDNLIIRDQVKLDFSDRFNATPTGDDLVLWNTLGSIEEITHSNIGMNGIGMNGSVIPESSTYALFIAGLGVIGTLAARQRMVARWWWRSRHRPA